MLLLQTFGALCLISIVHCEECGGLLNSTSGSIDLPSYQVGQGCRWTSNLPRLYITFTEFNLDDGDVLTVYDGPITQHHQIANFSQVSDVPFMVVCLTANSSLRFQSDESNNAPNSGFHAKYSTESGSLTSSKWGGVVKGPIYSNQTADPLNVTYVLQSAQTDVRLSLSFDQFDVTNGQLSVYDGVNASAPKVVSYDSSVSTKTPGAVIASQSALTIVMNLNTEVVQKISTSFISTECGGVHVLEHMNKTLTITSPSYPNTYPSMTVCQWLIKSPVNSTLLVNTHDMRLSPVSDYLRIVDGAERNGRTIVTFDAKSVDEDDVYLTSANELWIEFSSDQSQGGPGFNVTITPQVYSRFITVPSLLEITHTQNTTTIENEIIYQIQLSEEQQVQVRGNVAGMLMMGGAVQFYDGLSLSAPLLDTWVTDAVYNDVIANTNALMVVVTDFVNHGQPTAQTFNATVDSLSKAAGCKTSFDLVDTFTIHKPVEMLPTIWTIVNDQPNANDILLSVESSDLCDCCSINVYKSLLISDSNLLYTWNDESEAVSSFYQKQLRFVLSTASCNQSASENKEIYFKASYQIVPVCYKNITSGSAGSLSSTNYPNHYPYNTHCSWNFIPTTDNTTTDNILHMSFNYLQLSDAALAISYKSNHTLTYNHTMYTDVPDDILVNNATNMTVQVTFDSNTTQQRAAYPGQGFKLSYQYLSCGGSLNSTSKGIHSPGYPASPSKSEYCIWLVTLPHRDIKLNTTVNTMTVDLQMKHDQSNVTKLSLYDGASVHAPLVNTSAKVVQTRSNKLLVVYNYTNTENGNSTGVPFSINLKVKGCPLSDQCNNGVCMLSGWRCNGVNECGDYSDELDCGGSTVNKKSGVSHGALAAAIIVTGIFAVALTLLIPVAYRRYKARNTYGSLREDLSPVDT